MRTFAAAWASAIIWQALPATAADAQEETGAPSHEQRSFKAVVVQRDGDALTDIHGFSFGLVGDRVGRMKGLQFTTVYARVGNDLAGTQLSLGFNFIDGSFRGAQIAGLMNFAHDGRGLQLAGVFNLARNLHGAQVGFANAADHVQGVQLGVANGAGQLEGARLGLFNGAEELRGAEVGLINSGFYVRGFQVGLLNVPCIPIGGTCGDVNRDTSGLEIGLLNVAHAATGFQVGGINVTREARGFQLGLVNVAAKSEGESLALLNLIGDGLHEVALYSTDTLWSNLELKLGARHLFTGLIAAYQPGDDLAPGPERFLRGSRRFGLGLGVGWRGDLGGRWFESVELEVSGTELMSTFDASWRGHPWISSFRVEVPIRLFRNVRLLLGVTANLAVACGGGDADLSLGHSDAVARTGGTTVRAFPGFLVGVQL